MDNLCSLIALIIAVQFWFLNSIGELHPDYVKERMANKTVYYRSSGMVRRVNSYVFGLPLQVGYYKCYDREWWTSYNRSVESGFKLCPLYDRVVKPWDFDTVMTPQNMKCCDNPYGDEILLPIYPRSKLYDHFKETWTPCYKPVYVIEKKHVWEDGWCSPNGLFMRNGVVYYNWTGKYLVPSDWTVPCRDWHEDIGSSEPCEYPKVGYKIHGYYNCWLPDEWMVNSRGYCMLRPADFNVADYV